MTWWPGIDTGIGAIIPIALVVGAIIGTYKLCNMIWGEGKGDKVAEKIGRYVVIGIFIVWCYTSCSRK